MKFLQDLKEYDKDNIPTHVMAKIRKEYTSNENFDPAKVANASSRLRKVFANGFVPWKSMTE